MTRFLSLQPDPVAGGSTHDQLTTDGTVAPAWPAISGLLPVTTANVDPGVEQINRDADVTGQGASHAPQTLSSAPQLTFEMRAYPAILHRVLRDILKGSVSSSGTAPGPITSTIDPAQDGQERCSIGTLVREGQRDRVSGVAFNELEIDFPIDDDGTISATAFGLYHDVEDDSSAPTPAPTDAPTGWVYKLRDVTALLGPQTPSNAALTSAARTASGTSAVFDSGAATSLSATLDVTAASGTSPTLDVSLETSSDGGSTWSTVGSFPQRTAVGTSAQQTFSPLGAQCRWAWTIGGTSPSFTFSIAVAETAVAVDCVSGFGLTYTANLDDEAQTRFCSGRNVERSTVDGVQYRVWYPHRHQRKGKRGVTARLDFVRTRPDQELARILAKADQLRVEIAGGPLGTTPEADQMIALILHRIVPTGGGGGDLNADDAIRSTYEYGVYLDPTTNKDIQAQVVGTAAIS